MTTRCQSASKLGEVHSSDLYYQASKEGNSIVFRAPTLSWWLF
ncbi:MAG: hypothetical protein R2792_14630 [Saprospiraceae bacterium]